jgi:hypothetical protein
MGGNKMKQRFIITKVNHYDMGDSRGLSVRVVGDVQQTNNSFGLEISEAPVPNYDELKYLKQFADHLPAVFNANLSIGSVKGANGKEKSGVLLSNLEFVHSMEFVEKKIPAVNK